MTSAPTSPTSVVPPQPAGSPPRGAAPIRPLPDARQAHLYRTPTDQPIVALDVSKATLAVTIYDPLTSRGRQEEYANTPAGIRKLLQRTTVTSCWVLEPTGRYGNLAVQLAREAGRTVLLADPRRAQNFLRSGPARAKTDRLDSRGLAEYAAARPLPLYPAPSAVIEQTQQLLAARRGLSQALSRLRQQQRELAHAAAWLRPACESLEAQLAEVDRQLATWLQDENHAAELGAAARLDAVPGIGPVTAAAVAACLQSRSFAHPDQFVAYVGLDITVRDSGKKQGKRVVSQRGDGELRRLLYLAAQANLRSPHSPFRQQYEREKAKGLAHTAAVCAVARKLAKVCWSLVKHGGKYDPDRVHQQLPPRATGQNPHAGAVAPLPSVPLDEVSS